MLGSAMNIAAFNVGIAVAPWVSGLVIDAGPGLPGIDWVGAAFALAAVASALLDRNLTHRHRLATPTPAPAVTEAPEPASTFR
ncbi:hypothetical protein ACWD5B_09925 [Streptomyces tanashiensis]